MPLDLLVDKGALHDVSVDIPVSCHHPKPFPGLEEGKQGRQDAGIDKALQALAARKMDGDKEEAMALESKGDSDESTSLLGVVFCTRRPPMLFLEEDGHPTTCSLRCAESLN